MNWFNWGKKEKKELTKEDKVENKAECIVETKWTFDEMNNIKIKIYYTKRFLHGIDNTTCPKSITYSMVHIYYDNYKIIVSEKPKKTVDDLCVRICIRNDYGDISTHNYKEFLKAMEEEKIIAIDSNSESILKIDYDNYYITLVNE
jgi:hypothetical protein